MQEAIVLGGRLKVCDNGDVYRNTDDGYVLAAQSRTGRNRQYRVVSLQQDGKQKHYYVHRLVAEAFLPNPDNLPQVNHIDGNPSNNHVENLEWVTAKENVRHAIDNGLLMHMVNAEPCEMCGRPTMAKDGICPACKSVLKSETKKERTVAELSDYLGSVINFDRINPEHIEIIRMRMDGLTLSEIGDRIGVSKQRIDQIIKAAIDVSINGKKVPKSLLKERDRLRQKIIKCEFKLNLIDAERHQIETEISLLKNRVNVINERCDEAV